MTVASDRATKALQEVGPVVRGHAAQSDVEGSFPVPSVDALRASGLLGLLVPEEYGGMGGDLSDLISVADELAAHCLSTAMIWAMHCQQVDALVRYASEPLRGDILPRIARGAVYLASVTTEPGKGGHLLSAVAPLTEHGTDLRISRVAPVVTGGKYADAFLITMRADDAAADNQVSLVLAERSQLELEPTGDWNPLGMRATQSIGLTIEGAVSPHQLIGEAGGFRQIAVESMIPVGHLGWAACWLGTARGALSDVIALMRSPARPRSVDLQSDLAAERLARIRMELEVAVSYLRRVCDEVLAEREVGNSLDRPATQIHLNTLKVMASESSFAVVDRLVQFCGLSLGYLKDASIPLERHFRDLRSAGLNNSNDRLLIATGKLTLLDRSVRLA